MCSPYGVNLPKFFIWLLLVFDFHDPSSVAYAKISSIWFLLPSPCSCIMLGAKSSYAACVAAASCALTDPVLLCFSLPMGRVPSLGLTIGDYLLNYLRDYSWLLCRSGSWSHNHILIFVSPGMDSIHCGCDRGLPDNSCFLFTSIEACMSFVPNHHIVLLPEVTANQNASPQLTESSPDRPAASSLAGRQYRNREK